MKLACISAAAPGETDRLITETADWLGTQGYRLRGAVRIEPDPQPNAHHCDSDLRILPGGEIIRITQALGAGAQGCRLDPAAIAAAVAAVEARDSEPADIFILNKFGPEEAAGRGFCAALAAALDQGVPVLVGVGGASRAAFDAFAGGLAESLPAAPADIRTWCRAALRPAP